MEKSFISSIYKLLIFGYREIGKNHGMKEIKLTDEQCDKLRMNLDMIDTCAWLPCEDKWDAERDIIKEWLKEVTCDK